MPNGYSNDLRNRVLAYYDDNHTQIATCVVFNISRSTLNSWLKLKRETGLVDLRPRPKTRGSRKIDEQMLKDYMESYPDAHLHEIAHEFKVSSSAIWYACDRYGITRKKQMRYRERSEQHRQDFIQELAKLEDTQIVWVDECGINRDLTRLYGRSGQQIVPRVSMIGG